MHSPFTISESRFNYTDNMQSVETDKNTENGINNTKKTVGLPTVFAVLADHSHEILPNFISFLLFRGKRHGLFHLRAAPYRYRSS